MKTKVSNPRKSKGPSEAEAAARLQALAEWRRVHLETLETAQANAARRTGDVLPGILERLNLPKRFSEAEILRVWKASMDPKIVEHAQPVGLNKGTLFVDVDSNVWLHEIVRYHRRDILRRLQTSFGPKVVKKISFRVSG